MALAALPKQGQEFLDARTKRVSRPWWQFFVETRIQVVSVNTSVSAQTIDLAKLDGRLIVIKDESGNATANPITILGLVDNTLNPQISTDYGVLRVYANDRVWQSW